MLRFTIVLLVMMVLLGLVMAILGYRRLKANEASETRQREIKIFLTSLADVFFSLIGLAAVITQAFPPVHTLIATWVLLILIRVAIRK